MLAAAIGRTEDDVADEEEYAESVRATLATSAQYVGSLDPEGDRAARRTGGLGCPGRGTPRHQGDRASRLARRRGPPGWPRQGAPLRRRRVIVFTEYRDTQRYLVELLEAHGLGGDRLALLHGGMDEVAREHNKAVFQADPSRPCADPARDRRRE